MEKLRRPPLSPAEARERDLRRHLGDYAAARRKLKGEVGEGNLEAIATDNLFDGRMGEIHRQLRTNPWEKHHVLKKVEKMQNYERKGTLSEGKNILFIAPDSRVQHDALINPLKKVGHNVGRVGREDFVRVLDDLSGAETREEARRYDLFILLESDDTLFTLNWLLMFNRRWQEGETPSQIPPTALLTKREQEEIESELNLLDLKVARIIQITPAGLVDPDRYTSKIGEVLQRGKT